MCSSSRTGRQWGAHLDANDDTTGRCVRASRCGQFLEPWTGVVLKHGDIGHTLPTSHEPMGDHVR